MPPLAINGIILIAGILIGFGLCSILAAASAADDQMEAWADHRKQSQ